MFHSLSSALKTQAVCAVALCVFATSAQAADSGSVRETLNAVAAIEAQLAPDPLQASSEQLREDEQRFRELFRKLDQLRSRGPEIIPELFQYIDDGTRSSLTHIQAVQMLTSFGIQGLDPMLAQLRTRAAQGKEWVRRPQSEYASVISSYGSRAVPAVIKLAESSDASESELGVRILFDMAFFTSVGGTDLLEYYQFGDSVPSAHLPTAIVPKLLSGRDFGLPKNADISFASGGELAVKQWSANSIGSMRLHDNAKALMVLLGMLEKPMPEAVNAIEAALKDHGIKSPREEASNAIGRLIFEDKVAHDRGEKLYFAPSDVGRIVAELRKVAGDPLMTHAQWGAWNGLYMIAAAYPQYQYEVVKGVRDGTSTDLVTAGGALRYIDAKVCDVAIKALAVKDAPLALAAAGPNNAAFTVPKLVELLVHGSDEAALGLMQLGGASRSAIPALKKLASSDQRFTASTASKVLRRLQFEDCVPPNESSSHGCVSPDGPDGFLFKAMLAADDSIVPPGYKPASAAALYKEALESYILRDPKERRLMATAVADYVVILRKCGQEKDALAMAETFNKTGTLTFVPLAISPYTEPSARQGGGQAEKTDYF